MRLREKGKESKSKRKKEKDISDIKKRE